MATKFTLVLLSKIISKIRYSKSCILYHITYTTTEALLYQPLRFKFTFKSNRSMISFGRKHCKYDLHNMQVIFAMLPFKRCMKVYILYTFMNHFYELHLSLSLIAKTAAQSVCKNNSLFVCLFVNHYPQHVLCFYIISYLCVMHLFSV